MYIANSSHVQSHRHTRHLHSDCVHVHLARDADTPDTQIYVLPKQNTCPIAPTSRHSSHCVHIHLARDADTPDTLSCNVQGHWGCTDIQTSCEAVKIFTEMQTPQTILVRIGACISNLTDTPDTPMYIYCLMSTCSVSLYTCTPYQTCRHSRHSEYRYTGPFMQTPQTLPDLSTACRVQISKISDTQTPPLRICTYTSNLADTPDTSRYIYGLKSTHVQSAWVHVHTTRHADTPDILNIGAVATAMQTPQTLPGLSTT